MKNIKNYITFHSENMDESKVEDGNIKLFNKQKDSVIAQNKEYNGDPIPDSFKDKDPNYDIVISRKIEIGDPNPVQKFREWDGKYWERRKSKSTKAKK